MSHPGGMAEKAKGILKAFGLVALVLGLIWAEYRYRISAVVRPDQVEVWLEDTGVAAPIIFALAMAVAVIVSPIPSLPLDVVAGRVFGPLRGALYAVGGATLGACASFLIARFLGREFLARFFKGHVHFCRQCSDRLLSKVVFVSRLIPFVSFDLVSYGAGLTSMSLWKFALATFVGSMPLTLVYTSYGAVVLENRAILWIGGVVTVVLFFLLPRWIERYDLFYMKRYFLHDNGADAGE